MRFEILILLAAPSFAAASQDPQGVEAATAASASSDVVTRSLPPGALAELGDRLLFDEPGDGNVWARSGGWKASFGAAGLTYVPFFGSDAPQNYPVTLSLDAVTIAGEPLPFETAPKPVHSGKFVTLDRRTLRETYILDTESVEQTFVFDSLPTSGELRLHLAVETALTARAHGGGWAFGNERGDVLYGAATAVDADGRQVALAQRWTAGGIEITVPASFVARASFPLVVDPVLSTISVVSDPKDQVAVDVAYDGANEVYMIVYEEVQSAVDHDIISTFYNTSLGVLTSPSVVDATTSTWREPKVASCFFNETFLCVATRGTQVRRIWGRTRDAGSGSQGGQFQVSPILGTAHSPDVGGYGNDFNSSFSFCVVWEVNMPANDAAIFSRGVSHFGSLVGSVVGIANVPGQLDMSPRISKSSGRADLSSAEHKYMVVWEREESASNHDIWARVVDFDNDITGHSRFRAYSFSDALNADVSVQALNLRLSPDPYWVLVFERLRGADYDIFAVVARDGDADNARSVPAMQDVAEQDEQGNPRVAFDGQDYLIVYDTEAPGGGRDAYLTVLNVVSDGNELRTGVVERRAALRPLDGEASTLTIASNYDGGQVGQVSDFQALALWTAPGLSGTGGDVSGAFVQDITFRVIGSQYCQANDNESGTSAWIRANALSQDVAGTWQRLSCTDLPLNTFGFFLTSQDSSFTANPGGSAGNLCLGGTIGRYSILVASTGVNGRLSIPFDGTSLPQPNGSTSAAPGETWYFQCWSRDSLNGVATSNFSNAIAVTFL